MVDWKPLGKSPSTKRSEYRGWTLTAYCLDEELSNERLALSVKKELTEADEVRLRELNELLNQPRGIEHATCFMAHLEHRVLRATTEQEIIKLVDVETNLS